MLSLRICGGFSIATGCRLNTCPRAVLLQVMWFVPADELQDVKHLRPT